MTLRSPPPALSPVRQRSAAVVSLRQATRRVPEKQIQRDIIKTAKQFGCEVVSFSQPFAAKQMAGIADLRIYHRQRKRSAWFEVKAAGGRQSPGQRDFQGLVESVGERYVLGGVPELLELLKEWGFRLGSEVQPCDL